MSKMVQFEEPLPRDMQVWRVTTHREPLGAVSFYPAAGRYIFYNVPDGTDFTAEMLREIADFLDEKNKENADVRAD